MEEKKFGTSVFDLIPDKEEETIESDFFTKNEFNEKDIENQRNELKNEVDPRVKSLSSKDALNGMTAETIINPLKEFDDMEKDLEDKNIRGKNITTYSKSILKGLLGEDVTEDECKFISEKLEENKDTIASSVEDYTLNDNISISSIESIFPERVSSKLKDVAEDSGSYENAYRRLLYQIYFSYINTVETRDDISELNKIARMIKTAEIDFQNIKPEEVTEDNAEEQYDSLMKMNDSIGRYMEITKNLDDRNKRMKQDYSIDDYETFVFDEVKACLNDAISFKSVKDKVSSSVDKFKKDIKHVDDMNNSTENWISDIKNDPKVIYTFPCNDFLTNEESRKSIETFFFNTYISNVCIKENIAIPDNEDLYEYLYNNKFITDEDATKFKTMASWTLYIISRTFKYKKVKGNSLNIRKLSYTLDIISKLGIKDHMKAFIETSEFIYNKLSN